MPCCYSLKDRKKTSKLVGADVYVVRLGNEQKPHKSRHRREREDPSGQAKNGHCEGGTASPAISKSLTAEHSSLHDELTSINTPPPFPDVAHHSPTNNVLDRRAIRDSRPCYRCILYMHSAGIRRVFWTNSRGEWECAKIRDLFDRLGEAGDDSEDRNGIFVTKHEVLMLRQLSERSN
jgi:hypothetical protein